MNLSPPCAVLYDRKTSEGNLVLKGFQRRANFPPKIALLRFQTSQYKGQKISVSSRTFLDGFLIGTGGRGGRGKPFGGECVRLFVFFGRLKK